MRKKWLLRALCGLAACFTAFGFASCFGNGVKEFVVSDDYMMIDNETGEILCCVKPQEVTKIIFPSELDGIKVTRIAEDGFRNCVNLQSVVIPDGVTVGSEAFYGCKKLKNVTIGKNVRIEKNAFLGTSCFRSSNGGVYIDDYLIGVLSGFSGTLEVAEGTVGIADYACEGREELKGVIFPEGMANVGKAAFYNCENLESVTISSGMTRIEDDAFSMCTGLEEIYTDSLETWCGISFGSNPLAFARNLYVDGTCVKRLVIPDSVENILPATFVGCSATSVTIPRSVKSIGEDAFFDCNTLIEVCNKSSNITVTAGSKDNGYVGYYAKNVYTPTSGASKISQEQGVQIYTDGGVQTVLGYTGNAKNLTIPNNVTEISDYAFYGCDGVQTVTVQNGVTKIGMYAFYACDGLQTVELPDSVTAIGQDAFHGCKRLTEVNIPDGVEKIQYRTFYGCESLASIELSINVASIGEAAFYACKNLVSVKIPAGGRTLADGLEYIGSYAFYDCDSLVSVTLPWTLQSIAPYAFYDCDRLTSVIGGIQRTMSIGMYAFCGCDSLTDIVIGYFTQIIEKNAFQDCDSLTNVYYKGTASMWSSLMQTIGANNERLKNATVYYYVSKDEDLPSDGGKYWHYEDHIDYEPIEW